MLLIKREMIGIEDDAVNGWRDAKWFCGGLRDIVKNVIIFCIFKYSKTTN